MKPPIRYINNHGRINIPFRIRNQLGITPTTELKVISDNGRIIIEKVEVNKK